MKQDFDIASFHVARLGRHDADDQVLQALASVTLEGLQPSERSVQLARFVAIGQMSTTEQAVMALGNYYGRRA